MSVVTHRNQCIVSLRNDSGFSMDAVIVQVNVESLDLQMAALWHGIARIRREIHQHLLELHRVDSDAPQTLAGRESEFNILPINRGSVLAMLLTTGWSSTARSA